MADTKWTKGPWELDDELAVCGENFVVAIPWDDFDGDTREANAHLIAAAPDGYKCAVLLESLCAWLLNRFGPDSPEGKEASFRQTEAMAMLRKARGEPS